MNNDTLGSRIRTARRAAGLSLTHVAGRLLSRSFLSMIERDQRRPSPEILLGIAHRVNLTLPELLRDVETASQLPGLLRFGKRLDLQEKYNDAFEVLTAVLAHARRSSCIWAEASTFLGHTLTMIADYELAKRRLLDGLDSAEALGDPELRAVAHNHWGVLFMMRDRPDDAKVAFDDAWRLLRGVRLRDRNLPGVILLNLGQTEWDYRRPLAALTYYRQSLAVFRRTNDYVRQGKVLRLIGAAYDDAGLPEQAVEPLLQAARVLASSGSERHQARVFRSLGIVLKKIGDLGQARDYFLKSLQIAERYADNRSLAHTQSDLAQLALTEERWDEAMLYATRAVSAATKIEDVEEAARAEYVKARVLAHRGQLAKAVASFQWVIDVFEARGMHKELAEACSHLGRLHMRMGEMELASAALARALDLRSSGAA